MQKTQSQFHRIRDKFSVCQIWAGTDKPSEIIDSDFHALIKYKVAVCYVKLAQQEDTALYTKAESIVKVIYPTATVPKHREGLIYLWGHILYWQKRYDEARPKFDELIETSPQSIFIENAWYALGHVHLKTRNPEEGRKAFQQLLENFPDTEYKEEVQRLLAASNQVDK